MSISNLEKDDGGIPEEMKPPKGAGRWEKRRPLDDIPGLKLDVVVNTRTTTTKVEALGHTLIVEDTTIENDIDKESESWRIHFDGKLIGKMYINPDSGWPKQVFPDGRDKITDVRAWIHEIARAHKVNPSNILEIKDHQFPAAAIARCEFINCKKEDQETPAQYFRQALIHVWEL